MHKYYIYISPELYSRTELLNLMNKEIIIIIIINIFIEVLNHKIIEHFCYYYRVETRKIPTNWGGVYERTSLLGTALRQLSSGPTDTTQKSPHSFEKLISSPLEEEDKIKQ